MMYFDEAGTETQGSDHRRANTEQGSGSADQRHRLRIYCAALVRLRTARAAGAPPVRAAWLVAHEINDLFALDTRHSALLMHCLIAAAHET
jgi:hypothetical protein